jgi:hypothetical protein
MIRTLVLAAAATAAVGAFASAAQAADLRPIVKAPPVVVAVVEVCPAFYDDQLVRGYGWGTGPGTGLGFGTFEGALPRYPMNQFPNWYGWCKTWGHYSATGYGGYGGYW